MNKFNKTHNLLFTTLLIPSLAVAGPSERLMLAAQSGTLDEVTTQVRAGADPNTLDAQNEAVNAYLQHLMSVEDDARSVRPEHESEDGGEVGSPAHVVSAGSPVIVGEPGEEELKPETLHNALLSANHERIVAALAADEVDLNQIPGRATPPAIILSRTDYEDRTMEAFLRQHGIDLTRTTDAGNTLLIELAKRGKTALIRQVLAAGVSAHAKNLGGFKAIDYADPHGDTYNALLEQEVALGKLKYTMKKCCAPRPTLQRSGGYQEL